MPLDYLRREATLIGRQELGNYVHRVSMGSLENGECGEWRCLVMVVLT